MVCASQQSSNTSYCNRKYNECMEGKEHSGLNSGGWGIPNVGAVMNTV